jgi:hypothetical protein
LQRRILTVAFAATLFALCVSPVACSGEGEGQRCSTNDDPGGPTDPSTGAYSTPYSAGSSDCAGNLVCWPASDLGAAAQQYFAGSVDKSLGICCPYPRNASDSVAICSLEPSPPGGDAAPPGDASTGDAAPESDAGDSGAFGESDGSSDALADVSPG